MNVLSTFALNGKTALVSGCNRGIGKSMAVALAEAGADIIGVSASLQLKGSAVEEEVRSLGRQFSAYQADFSDRRSLYAFIEKAKKEHNTIDPYRSIPIIALVADAIKDDYEKCREAGMNDYISKPFRLAEIQEKLQVPPAA